ncbi:MAG: LysR family transcriptional regulator [Sphaerochaetaceae bacterium]|nr:LysR family transcriptional regulator [Sphaerochaetaceae bacterium]
MNLLHLKYVVEVEKSKSISKAADNLHMGQPNLSRGIRELEDSIGITIFNRSSRGITVTEKGEEFILYAKAILDQVDYVESFYRKDNEGQQTFSISVVRSSYIMQAFAEFSKDFDLKKEIKLRYKESNSENTMNDIIKGDFNLGIIRYSEKYSNYFEVFLKEKGLISNEILDFTSFILVNKKSSLAKMKKIRKSDLKEKIEIVYGDFYIPNMHITEIKKRIVKNNLKQNIQVFDRASCFELLEKNLETYFCSSPLNPEELEKYQLIQLQIEGDDEVFKDVLISRSTYRFSLIDKNFLNCLTNTAREIKKKISN